MITKMVSGQTVKRSAFITEYARTDNLSQACRVAGINRSTGYRFLEMEDFQIAIQLMRSKIVNAAWTKLSNNIEIAVERVVEILNDPRTTVNAKLRATELVFNYTSHYTDNADNKVKGQADSLNAEQSSIIA